MTLSPAKPDAAPPTTDSRTTSLHPLPVPHRTRLDPAKSWQAIDFRELWHFRELTWLLALRDIRVRYKQTLLGAAWAIIQPLLTTLIMFVMFYKVAGLKIEGSAPQLLLMFAGMLIWQLFETSITNASNSLVGSQNLITKVYFPRLTVPIAALGSGVLDFLVGAAVLVIMMFCYHVRPGWAIVTLPVFILLTMAASVAVGLWLSALNVQYRDVRYAIPFLARIWFFATPIVYPLKEVGRKLGPRWLALYGLNPMTVAVEGFRWSMFGGSEPPSFGLMAISSAATIILLIGGLYYFRRMEQTFADVV